MLHIDEQTLAILLASQSISQIELRPAGKGFGVFVCIARVGEGPTSGMLITSRTKHQREKKPRTWASADSCIAFLRAKAPKEQLPEIKIHTNKGERDQT
ncbi:hypothetical protein TB15x_20630 [Xanthomonas perforans]|uniref:hypothetical protein n=1 Tax=Xanthomonas perforans TaxID=442694 RepID=UPI00062D43E5|nr:hypothetical protein [Xanthomonas perforans]KLD35826.1 hypothetical protein TB15x_20630 [Xanthomonas perforans]MBZ2436250.1 hypothetical protein [Xanthomonas perforans]MBZ2461362.1 hypothetical protein [Xanthomonas perforans]MBZ2482788.1 hypothetical protein [Xanthomonas perforans]MBZ2491356.1 hypothetical protein [Xanthomonas perforans]